MSEPAREGAKQPERFNPDRAARLDDPARFAYLPAAGIIALLDPGPGATVVDFGAGTGTYALEIARARPDVRVIALDEQPRMLERLEAKLESSGLTNIEPANPGRLPGLRGSVTAILALNVLHELGDAALAELASLLTPGGRALIVDWNADVERPHGPPREHVYGPDEASRRLGRAGFRTVLVTLFPYHYALTVEPERVSSVPVG